MEAGFRLGCDRSYLKKIADGTRCPGRRIANTIEELSASWSDGPIKAMEWDRPVRLARASSLEEA